MEPSSTAPDEVAALAPTQAAAPALAATAPTLPPQPEAAPTTRRTNLLLLTGSAALVLALAAGFLLGARRGP